MPLNETLHTPVEIDTAIAQARSVRQKAEKALQVEERRIGGFAYDRHAHSKANLAFIDALNAQQELEAQYTGWPRYYHVANNNGHIHTSMFCQSCFPDTQYMWRTDLSGLSVEEVVEREAYNACTVCMPIAPAEQKAARVRYNAEQKAARDAEKLAKKHAKTVKAAERAVKLIAKVDQAIADAAADGIDVFALDYSQTYHFVYAFEEFAGRKELQSTVANIMLDDVRRRNGERSLDRDPREIINEARAAGLI